MIDALLSTVAPHPCSGCGKTGSVLCQYCKYDIISEGFDGCLLCSRKNSAGTICDHCCSIAQRGWCVGGRTDVLQKLIDDYKFENVRAAYKALADLLDEKIDMLPSTTVVVPVPTIARHIRERGYDHAALIAKEFARRRRLTYKAVIQRQDNNTQREASRAQRLVQAQKAFQVRSSLPTHPYLLIDDIVTTGATLTYAVKALRDAGATEIWIAAIARQPLD